MDGTAHDETSREVWLMMSDLVLDNARRREVSDALGMSSGRARAIRRLARSPMSMGELASALGIDRPNATVLVEATREGMALARRADEILGTPPPGLSALGADELATMRRMLLSAGAPPRG